MPFSRLQLQSHNCGSWFLSQCVFLSNEARNVAQLEENHVQPWQTGQSMQNGFIPFALCPCLLDMPPSAVLIFLLSAALRILFQMVGYGFAIHHLDTWQFLLRSFSKTRRPLSSQTLTPFSYSHVLTSAPCSQDITQRWVMLNCSFFLLVHSLDSFLDPFPLAIPSFLIQHLKNRFSLLSRVSSCWLQMEGQSHDPESA